MSASDSTMKPSWTFRINSSSVNRATSDLLGRRLVRLLQRARQLLLERTAQSLEVLADVPRPVAEPLAQLVLELRQLAVGAEERIAVVRRRIEPLLDRPRGHPAQEVQVRAGFVVGSAGPRAAERLLAHHGP